jgi:hypothetical protein
MSDRHPDALDMVKQWRSAADQHDTDERKSTSFEEKWEHRNHASTYRRFAASLEDFMKGTP